MSRLSWYMIAGILAPIPPGILLGLLIHPYFIILVYFSPLTMAYAMNRALRHKIWRVRNTEAEES